MPLHSLAWYSLPEPGNLRENCLTSDVMAGEQDARSSLLAFRHYNAGNKWLKQSFLKEEERSLSLAPFGTNGGGGWKAGWEVRGGGHRTPGTLESGHSHKEAGMTFLLHFTPHPIHLSAPHSETISFKRSSLTLCALQQHLPTVWASKWSLIVGGGKGATWGWGCPSEWSFWELKLVSIMLLCSKYD